MKLKGKDLDNTILQYGLERQKGEADVDLRKRAMRHFKEAEMPQLYFEMKLGKTCSGEQYDKDIWNGDDWKKYNAYLSSIGEEAVEKPRDTFHNKWADEEIIVKPLRLSERKTSNTMDDEMAKLKADPDICFVAFRKAVYEFKKFTTRWPTSVVIHSSLAPTIVAKLKKMDPESELFEALDAIRLGQSPDLAAPWTMDV